MDRFANLFGSVLLITFGWLVSAAANSDQSAFLKARPSNLPRAQLRTVIQEDHRIIIDSDGVSPETGKYQAQLEHMFQTIERQPRHRLLLFVHGGLTTLASANELAQDVGRRIETSSPDKVIGYQLLPASDRIHLKAFGLEPHDCPAGYSSGPRRHGEFPEFEFWNPDFWRTTDPPESIGGIPPVVSNQ